MDFIKTLKKVKRIYLNRKRLNMVIKNIGDDILRSAEKNNDPRKCFADNKVSTPDATIIERIINSYNKAKEVQKTLPPAYQVGNEWLPIYNRYMNSIMTALASGDVQRVNKIYENFMREECSIGLHGLPFDMNEAFFKGNISKLDGEIYLLDTFYRLKYWKELTNNQFKTSDLKMPPFGNDYGYFVDNDFIRTGAEYLHYYATRISDLINYETKKKVVVELGGGYGGLGYFLNKMISGLTYVDFDLPENMALTAYFLMASFPDKKVLLYGEDEFNSVSFDKYDIIIMPNFELENLPTNSVSLVFNSYSLAEMTTDTINTYIPNLKRASKKHVLHVNHTVKSHSLNADDFGIEDNDFKLVYRNAALWNLGRNANMDEYEFLYSKALITG